MRHSSQDEGGVCITQRRLFRGLTAHSQAVFRLECQSPVSPIFVPSSALRAV